MRKLNIILTLYSLTAFIIILERLSFTTKIFLQPHNFIRPHELIQTGIFMTATIILSFLLFKEVTNNFQSLKQKNGTILACLFAVGIYLFGAGEGWHEMASFLLNTYCDPLHAGGNLCGGLFINDYIAGNLMYFIGGVMMNIILMYFALQNPIKKYNRTDISILLANSIVFAFTWFAYAAFDVVRAGLYFAVLLMIISIIFALKVHRHWQAYPYIFYSVVAYTLATVGTVVVRFLK